ncbi:hypothetical protein CC79DRAFT_1164818 [Sarocladium strictum]
MTILDGTGNETSDLDYSDLYGTTILENKLFAEASINTLDSMHSQRETNSVWMISCGQSSGEASSVKALWLPVPRGNTNGYNLMGKVVPTMLVTASCSGRAPDSCPDGTSSSRTGRFGCPTAIAIGRGIPDVRDPCSPVPATRTTIVAMKPLAGK